MKQKNLRSSKSEGFGILCNILLGCECGSVIDFECLCGQIGESARVMENFLYEEFGLSAPELLSSLGIVPLRAE